jgi:putative aldouronate transport system substrate-binding protein
MNTAVSNIFIRKDWLDALGLPEPTTIAEFQSALRAFRDRDPGGVGRNLVPLGLTHDVRFTVGNILSAHIDPGLSPKERWINIVINRHLLLPGYKDGVRLLNQWFNEGLLDRNFPLYTSDQEWNNLIKSGFVGAAIHNWDQIYREGTSILADLQANVPGANMVPIDPIQSRDGVRHKLAHDSAGLLFFIPVTSRNVEGSLRYLNWLARFENYHFLQVGPEGVVHDVINGIPTIKNAEGLWIQNSPQNIDYTIHVNGLDLGDPYLNTRVLAVSYPWPAEVIEKAFNTAMANASPDPVVPVPLSASGPVAQTLLDKTNVLLSEAITSNPNDFDRIWDQGIADFLQIGGQAVIDERRAKYPW